MNKAFENVIEIGVNLLMAVAVISIINVTLSLGRETVISYEKQLRAEARTEQRMEFGSLNGTTVTYARAIELLTLYAGDLDIYVDSTCDNGAILISSQTWLGAESWATAPISAQFPTRVSARCIGGYNLDYFTAESMMIADTQTLLASDLSEKFATGKWTIYLALNGELVTKCTGRAPTDGELVTGLRFKRIQ